MKPVRAEARFWPIVLQNDFERWSEEYFSEIARQRLPSCERFFAWTFCVTSRLSVAT